MTTRTEELRRARAFTAAIHAGSVGAGGKRTSRKRSSMTREDTYDVLAHAGRPLSAVEVQRTAALSGARGTGLDEHAVSDDEARPTVLRHLRALVRLDMAERVGRRWQAVPGERWTRRGLSDPTRVRIVRGVPHPPLVYRDPAEQRAAIALTRRLLVVPAGLTLATAPPRPLLGPGDIASEYEWCFRRGRPQRVHRRAHEARGCRARCLAMLNPGKELAA